MTLAHATSYTLGLHEVCVESRHVPCYCAPADQLCDCGTCGVHYARVARAAAAQIISLADFATAIHDDVFTGGDILIDPQAGQP